jgi:hypothetical protein
MIPDFHIKTPEIPDKLRLQISISRSASSQEVTREGQVTVPKAGQTRTASV